MPRYVTVREDWIAPDVNPSRLFIDSGAHSLYNIEAFPIKSPHRRYDYYKTERFWKYVDNYANFIKEHTDSIDFYANVDVIHNPELSWKVQKYLEEEHGLNPIPVIHAGTSLKWVEKHLEEGYDYLGIGGVSLEGTDDDYIIWADQIFDLLCPHPSRLPIVKTHGFANTNYASLIRYPWTSVDSSSWAKASGYGNVFIPHKRGGKFTFDENPYIVTFSWRSPAAKRKRVHFVNFPKAEQRIIMDWLDEIGMPMGEVDEEGNRITEGVINHYGTRALANMIFFERVRNWLPKWPWPFKVNVRKGFFL